MSLPGYDDWLDNHGNPGIDEPECLANHCPPSMYEDCQYPICTPEGYAELQYEHNAASDIDSDIR